MVQFGWSIGDIATSIKIILSIIKAFDQAKGAKKQYATSCGFLRQLVPVLRRIEVQIETSENPQHQADLLENCQAINEAYRSFDEYLQKKYNGLSAKEPSKAKQILATVRWSLDELHEKVQKLQARISDAMLPYQTLMIQEIEARVTEFSVDFRRAATSVEQSNERFREINDMFLVLKEQNKTINETTLDLKLSQIEEQQKSSAGTAAIRDDLTEQRRQHTKDTAAIRTDFAQHRDQQSQETAALRSDVIGMKSEQEQTNDLTKMRLDFHEDASARMLQSQKDLVDIIQQQKAHTGSQEDGQRWSTLQSEAKEEAVAAEQAHKQVQCDIDAAAGAIGGIHKLTGNKEIGVISEKAKAFGELFGVFGLFNRSKKDDSPPACTPTPEKQADTAQMPQTQHQRRGPKPPPPVSTPPPPRRVERPVSVPLNVRAGTQRSSTTRAPASPPPSFDSRCAHASSVTRQSLCSCDVRRDSVTSAMSSNSSASRPPLPSRPQTDSSLPRGSVDRELSTRPPLPPRSPDGRSQIATNPGVLRSTQSSTTVSTLSAVHGGRRPSAQWSNAGRSPPQLASSPATISSSSSPPIPADDERCFSAGPSIGAVRVEKWIASTSTANIEMDVFDSSVTYDQPESSGMSVSQRRNMFEGSPIMSMGSPLAS